MFCDVCRNAPAVTERKLYGFLSLYCNPCAVEADAETKKIKAQVGRLQFLKGV